MEKGGEGGLGGEGGGERAEELEGEGLGGGGEIELGDLRGKASQYA